MTGTMAAGSRDEPGRLIQKDLLCDLGDFAVGFFFAVDQRFFLRG
jgi:hypothetical protein